MQFEMANKGFEPLPGSVSFFPQRPALYHTTASAETHVLKCRMAFAKQIVGISLESYSIYMENTIDSEPTLGKLSNCP
jgi:hypothetical protein